jgi:hypothetical protein
MCGQNGDAGTRGRGDTETRGHGDKEMVVVAVIGMTHDFYDLILGAG